MRDRDGIPNLADPFPDDALRPKVVRTNTVYAHTATELYLFGVKGQVLDNMVVSGAVNVPLNDQGIRADAVGTVAVEMYF